MQKQICLRNEASPFAGQYGELMFVPFRSEVLEEASARETYLGGLANNLASANLAIFNTPFDLIVRFEAHGSANGLRESQSVLFVDCGRIHGGIIRQKRPFLKRFSVHAWRPTRKGGLLEQSRSQLLSDGGEIRVTTVG
jgi:hypothetical protein